MGAAILLGTVVFPGSAPAPTQHKSTKLEGYAIAVFPDSITVLGKKGDEVKILTDKDYTSAIGMGAVVTVWYENKSGVNRLEDIRYAQEGFFLPSDDIRTQIKRLIILPEAEEVENSQGLIAAIANYLRANAGWFVAPAELAQEVAKRQAAPASPLDAINPNTGEVDLQKFVAAQGSPVVRVAEETRSDAVLEIKVEKVKAEVRGSVAIWDDMKDVVAGKGTRAISPLEGFGGKSWVYAVTVDMHLWSRSGKLLWKTRRGFAALGFKSGMGFKYRARPLTEVYTNQTAMENWLVTTLGDLAPPTGVTKP